MPITKLLKISLIIFLFFMAANVYAAEFTVFNPENYVRGTGDPVKISRDFSVLNTNTEYYLRIYNGGLQDNSEELVSSSIITLNGQQVVGPEKFNQTVKFIEVPVTLQLNNTIDVEVRGKPGGVLTIRIAGIDSAAPGITIIEPLNNSLSNVNLHNISLSFNDDIAGLNPDSFNISINGLDKTGSFPSINPGLTGSTSASLALSEGVNVIKASIADFAANSTTTSVSFTIDTTAPMISNLLPAQDAILANAQPKISADFNDNISGVDTASVKITLDGADITSNAEITSAGFSYTPSSGLPDGSHSVTVDVKDKAGNPGNQGQTNFITDITPPKVIINQVTSPANVKIQVITGSYTEEHISTIKVNGIDASIDNTNNTYSAQITLSEGTNNINVIVADLAGNTGTASADIFLDTTPPAVPGGLTATVGNTIVDLSWPGNNESDFAGYNISRSQVQGGPYSKLNSSLITANSYQDTGLTNGTTYYYVITAQDKLGNESEYSLESAATPQIQLKVTAGSDTVKGISPLTVNFSADVIGNIIHYEWDFDGDNIYDWSSSNSANTTYVYRTVGNYNAKIKVTDAAGNIQTDSVDIEAGNPLALNPVVYPLKGTAPLNVTFNTQATDPTGTIINYEWDFDGDGIYDWFSALPGISTHRYTTIGTYNAVFRVTNNYGLTNTAVVTISVTTNVPLVSNYSVSPEGGPVPLKVSFTGNASSPNGAIAKCEWDFDGDGTYDWNTTYSTANTSYTYTDPGTYYAVLRATDVMGQSSTAVVIVTALPAGSPTVYLYGPASTIGNAPFTVGVYASVPNGGTVMYEWDFNNDGIVDSTSQSANYTYTDGGVYDIRLKVTDYLGNVGYAGIRVFINVTLSLTRNKDTFNATQGETVTVTDKNSGGADIKLYVKDSNGQIVRTLVNEHRADGTYTDVWDGRNENGNIVPDGPYYFVEEAAMPGGLSKTYDLTGAGITGTVSAIGGFSATFPASFSPYEGILCPITYTVPVAGKVTADICPLSYDGERIRALLQSEPQGKGTHTIYWDGVKDDGAMVSPDDQWLVSIWSYDLTFNGVMIEGGKPEINNLSADANYYSPAEMTLSGFKPLKLSFNLSKSADVIVKIYDSTNVLIRTISQNLAAGDNTISWDGKNEQGEYVNDSAYHIGVKAVDSRGNHSLTRFANIILFY